MSRTLTFSRWEARRRISNASSLVTFWRPIRMPMAVLMVSLVSSAARRFWMVWVLARAIEAWELNRAPSSWAGPDGPSAEAVVEYRFNAPMICPAAARRKTSIDRTPVASTAAGPNAGHLRSQPRSPVAQAGSARITSRLGPSPVAI